MNIVLKAVYVVLVATVSARQSSILWQGFRHQWKRSLVTFKTPHRMGSIENQIIEKSVDNEGVNAEAHFTFVPGVNGDYANPEAYYSDIQINDSENLKILEKRVNFEYTDQISNTGEYARHNEANFSKSIIVKIDDDGFEMSEPMIGGYNIQMKCVGQSCNSDGIWPFKFNVSVAKTGNKNEFKVDYIMNRGWTPSHGGGKALNPNMYFNVTIPIKLIQYNTNVAQSSSKMMEYESSVTGMPHYSVSVINFDPNFNGQMAIVGINTMGFQIMWQSKYADRGRYIEELEFFIKSVSYDDQEQRALIGFQHALLAPAISTYKAKAQFTLGITAIAVTDAIKLDKGPTKIVSGNICINDWTALFWCSFVKMQPKTHDIVPFKVVHTKQNTPVESIY